jgi:hypothetical protein
MANYAGGAMFFSDLAQLVGMLIDIAHLLLRTDQSKEIEILLLRRQLTILRAHASQTAPPHALG